MRNILTLYTILNLKLINNFIKDSTILFILLVSTSYILVNYQILIINDKIFFYNI